MAEKAGKGLGVLLGGLLIAGTSYQAVKKYEDSKQEDKYLQLSTEDLSQRKQYFEKVISLKELLISENPESDDFQKLSYSMDFMSKFFGTVIEGCIVPFRALTKEYREKRRFVDNNKDKNAYYQLVDDYLQRYDKIIQETQDTLIESLEGDEEKLNLSIDILLGANNEFADFYNSLRRNIIKRSWTACPTELQSQYNQIAYLKLSIEYYKSLESDETHEGWTIKNAIEYKIAMVEDFTFQELEMEFDYALSWVEKWRLKEVGEFVDQYYKIIDEDRSLNYYKGLENNDV